MLAQDPAVILDLMADLEQFINGPGAFDANPLIKMALLHHQFESIHPFYDDNGRTGRTLNVLYLVRTKPDYYRRLQGVRDQNGWEDWTLYMLTAVEETARQTIEFVSGIQAAQTDYKRHIRAGYKFYSQDTIDNLFMHPYTKIEFMEQDMAVSRLTAFKYLEALTAGGFLEKRRLGRSNYYMNVAPYRLLAQDEAAP